MKQSVSIIPADDVDIIQSEINKKMFENPLLSSSREECAELKIMKLKWLNK
jgi:hypothetical protein